MKTDKLGFVTFEIWSDGDPSVGINGDRATVHTWVGDDEDYQEFIRDTLHSSFAVMWDWQERHVHIMTEEEIGEGEERIEEGLDG